jgi:ABC-2 type transport system ATP-binding protein
MSGAGAIVSLEGVSKWYGEVLGLSDVSVTIGPGLTGLLGVNGAGKSTFLKLVTGQLRADRGRVLVLGEPSWRNPPLMRRIGLCPEQDSFYEEMTGHAWLAWLARLGGLGREAAADRAAAVLEAVDLAAERRKRIGRYSKGMRQRLKIAQALLAEPEVLFLDEPLAGTDPIARARIVRLIQELAASGRHVIMSSHILHEVESLTDTIVLLHQGRLRAEGRVADIRRLLVDHPCEVRIEVDRPRALCERLMALEPVRAVELAGGDALLVRAENQETFFRALGDLIVDGGFAVTRLVPLDDRLESVFEQLVGSR